MSGVGTPIRDPNVAEAIGAIRAQLKELIHDRNNSAMRDEAVARSLAKLEELPSSLAKFERHQGERLDKIEERLKSLEEDKVRRDQTTSLGALILKSPMVAWLITGVAFLWGILTGRIHFGG